MDSRAVIRRLNAEGWFSHHVKGDHHQLKHPSKPGKVTVIHPAKDIPVGTLRSIFKQAGWNWKER